MSTAPAHYLAGPLSTRRVLLAAFWVWFGISAVLFLMHENPLEAVWPLSLGLVMWGVLKFRAPLQRFAARLPFPVFIKYLAFGIFFFDVIMENFAVSFKGDLHPNLFLDSFLWLGSCLGVMCAWWLVAQFFWFRPWEVFFLYGLKGVLLEQDFLLPRMIMQGQFFDVVMIIPYLIVVYGSAVAPVFVVLEKELPRPPRRPGLAGAVVGVVLSAILFYAGAYVWFRAFGFLLKPVG